MNTRNTGLLISDTRKEKGLTQKELAEMLHVSDRTVSKWERGAGFPDVTLLEPLSDALGISVHSLLSGEPESGDHTVQDDRAVRDAIKAVCAQYKRKMRKNIGRTVASIFLTVFFGFFLFAILDYTGAFLRDVQLEVPAAIYEGGEAVGETVVRIDGSLKRIGRKNFQGTFSIECVEKTGRKDVSAYITYDREGFQQISYYSPGIARVSVGIKRRLYISPDMRQFALTLDDGRVVATNVCAANLQEIDGCRYALSYKSGYPYFSYADY
ncbi:helix-turn-helix domain-containing protein [Oscillibacter sp. MSJ-2]|uniref:Helix-turn-helix domain-containing protein n=1 Tax=Dysosmobacter acutus TaxID=2841504 RepID=A0ABS6F9S9_9FIRM|nr:helix-turn-helix transcriptional regulator [Dysosmobacter acutus]MBU5627051.1 helix-turn-helix domain-containing protein [Dysosmobacter acutus]